MSQLRNKRSMTLMEVIIGLVLFSIIVLGVANIDIFSRYQTINSDRRANLQNEVTLALDHMAKNIGRAVGNTVINPPVIAYTDNNGIRVRIDDNPANGQADATDQWIAYRHHNISTTDSEILFCPNVANSDTPPQISSCTRISNRIVRTDLTQSPPVIGLEFTGNWQVNTATGFSELHDNMLGVNIFARWFPDRTASQDNPEINMRANISMPSVSTN